MLREYVLVFWVGGQVVDLPGILLGVIKFFGRLVFPEAALRGVAFAGDPS